MTEVFLWFMFCAGVAWIITREVQVSTREREHKSKLDAVSEASADLAKRHLEINDAANLRIAELERDHPPVAAVIPPQVLKAAKARAEQIKKARKN